MNWSLSATVLVALAVVLLPLGILAAKLAVDMYRSVAPQEATAMSVRQAAVILLPLVMWLAALLTGWALAHRLVVVPLTGMRRDVERYAAGDASVRLGGQEFSSQEMTALSQTFDRMADSIDRHDSAMQTALTEQKRLTREVHHRVKNNLQIVSSLLSIQSRETNSPEIARAYGSVQARVNALALVHRWMYEDEHGDGAQGRGVDLKSLITDLCASLERHLTASEGFAVHVRCEVDRCVVGQDHAVPLAFLITELATMATAAAAAIDGHSPLDVLVTARVNGDRARLNLCSRVFGGDDLLSPAIPNASARIVLGMARQLRSPLRHYPDGDCYEVEFPLTRAMAG